MGHNLRLDYNEISFPNRRIGAFDRLAIIFKIKDYASPLDLWNCMDDAFLTTPTAISLRVKDVIIVFVSGNYLLSPAFGLGSVERKGENLEYIAGSGLFAPGFGSRISRIPSAKILAQPMRRQHQKSGFPEDNRSLQDNGDGKVYLLKNNRWERVKSCDFSDVPVFFTSIGETLASIETIEWIILSKEYDFQRYGNSESIFVKSLPKLQHEKEQLMAIIAQLRGGISISENDRAPDKTPK